MSVTGLIMSFFSTMVLKLYLDTFLHKAKGIRGIAGWLPFYIWQRCSETVRFPGHITLFFTFMTIVSVGFAVYTGTMWKRCVFPAVYLAIWMLLEGVAVYGIRYISGMEPGFLLASAVSKTLLFLVTMGIRRLARKKGVGKEPYGGGMVFFALPVVGMVLYHTLYQLLQARHTDQTESGIWMLVAAAALILLNLCFYPMYVQLVRNLHMKKSEHFYMRQLELFRQENAMEEAAASEIRELRHDMRQHLIYLGELLRDGKPEVAQAALADLVGETEKRGRLESRTGNMVVDSMINHAWKSASDEGILFHANTEPLPELSIRDADLCVLLGNALDNALEACRAVQDGEKAIWIALGYFRGCLSIQIKNSCEGTVELSADGRIPSRKREGGYGFGLFSMERIVDRYHGRMDVKPDGKVFNLEILIYC